MMTVSVALSCLAEGEYSVEEKEVNIEQDENGNGFIPKQYLEYLMKSKDTQNIARFVTTRIIEYVKRDDVEGLMSLKFKKSKCIFSHSNFHCLGQF